MVLKAYREKTFTANVRFEDDSIKEVVFRLPRNTDIYDGGDGNSNLNILGTLSNMAKPFDTPVQVETENGSILNILTLKELVSLGVQMNFSDVIQKWDESREQSQAEKEALVKKSASVGGSKAKVTPQEQD